MADGCIGPINIIPDNNEVVLQDVNQTITVIDNNCCTTVDIVQPTTEVIQILTGPMGKFPTEGPYGFTGSFGISGSLTVTGSISSNYIQSPYFTGSFYGNGTGIFSGSFSGSVSSTLQDITNNGNVTTLPITASNYYGNGLQIVGNATVTGSLTVSGSNTFRNIGPAQFTGSTDITGSLSINGIDYEFTSASFDTRILNNSSSISLLSSSYEQFSASYTTASFTGSFTGSLLGTSSWSENSITASYVQNAQTASYVLQAVSSSFSTTASFASTASYVKNAQTASYVNPLNQNVIITGSLSQGLTNQATGIYSHAEGRNTKATGSYSHAEGISTIASGSQSHAEGNATQAIGASSHAEGVNTIAKGDYSHAEGLTTISSGSYSHAEGNTTQAKGDNSHAEGNLAQAIGNNSHAEGNSTQAIGAGSHAEGNNTKATGSYSHTEGFNTRATGSYSHAEGSQTQAIGLASHAEGNTTIASSSYSHAEGSQTQALGGASHAEGNSTQAIGASSHAEGDLTFATGNSSHAEGFLSSTDGVYSHAEGVSTITYGTGSHVEGYETYAEGDYSHAEGIGVQTYGIGQHASGKYNVGDSTSLFIIGNGIDDTNRSNIFIVSDTLVEVSGSLGVTQGITGSLLGTASYALNAKSSSFASTASYVKNAQTASYVLNAVSSSYSATASYLNTLNQNLTFNGNLTLNGTASITYLDVTYESASVIYSSGSNQLGDATNDIQTLIGTVKISGSQQITGSSHQTGTFYPDQIDWINSSIGYNTGSYILTTTNNGLTTYANYQDIGIALFPYINTGSFSGSLDGTASYAINAATASNILGGKATHIPFFITDTTLATSSIYQSGSTSVIINQDANTTANPEALYVWQPSTSSFNVISGKGNLNNYLQLNIQNTNQGDNASSDVVATANNGNESTNYIDMGINSENFIGTLGGPNDAYLYSTGTHLHIGNASPYYVAFFAGGDDVDINNKLLLDPSNYHQMTGSLDISGSLIVRDGITGSLNGTASYANSGLSSSYALTASYALNVPVTASYAISSSYAVSASHALNSNSASSAVSASHALNTDNSNNAVSASHALNADNANNATYAATAGNGGVTQIIAGSGITLIPTNGQGAVTVIASGGGGVTIISGSLVTGSFTSTTSYTFNHNLSTRTPIITVFDTNYNQIIPQNIQLVDTASAIITFPTLESGFAIGSTGGTTGTAYSSSYALFATYADTASYFVETDPIFVAKSGSFATTGSNSFKGNQVITGSLIVSGSNTITIIGPTTITGSLLVSGSTTQIGNNTLTGNTILSGSISVSGSQTFNGNMGLTGSLTISGSTTQIGDNKLLGNTTLSGSITISGSTTNVIIGNTEVYGGFNVSGSSTFSDTTFTITGSQYFTGSSFINGSQTLSGNSIISGTLDVLGNINVISGSSFTRWGNKLFNYGAFSDYTTQSGSANTAHAIRFNTTDVALEVFLSGSSAIKILNTGIYNFQWSGQLNQGANSSVVSIWLRVNGTDVPGSRGDVSLGSNNSALPAWNYVLPFNANDAIELYWSSTSANTTWVFAPVAITPPRPSTASIIATLTQIA